MPELKMLRAVLGTAGSIFMYGNGKIAVCSQPDHRRPEPESVLQCDDVPVIRHIQLSPVIGLSLCRIERLAFREPLIFGVPQEQMGDFKRFGQFAGLLYRAVVLFVRFKAVSVFVEAEGLVEQPGASACNGYTFAV